MLKKLLSIACAASIASSSFAFTPVTTLADEHIQLTYMDGETEFLSYTYDNANPNKTLKLKDDVQLEEGIVTITFDLDSHTDQCNYRAGMQISGETIYVNANTATTIGDWPAPNNAVGYHINYNYNTTATVTYAITLNSEGNATAIDCSLVDSNGVSVSGKIDVKMPQSINEISLKSAQRGGSQQITLSGFETVFTSLGSYTTPEPENTDPPADVTQSPSEPLESSELVYNDGSGSRFENFTYTSANPNKTYTLTSGTKLGAGTVKYTFHLDCGGADCHYRAGLIIAGETILINALSNGKGTTTGDWPSHNNDGWHVDGYHMNFDYPAVTADVTFTLTLNDDGKATAIDCLLIDGKGAQAHGTITLDQPASVDTIKLVSEERGGSGNIALTNFKAVYSSEEGGIVTMPPIENTDPPADATQSPSEPLESSELVYNDGNGSRFENFTYTSANPNKTYTLTSGTKLGAGTVKYTFHLDCGGADCHYRAGLVIGGKTILINALSNGKGTTTGDWPSHNNDGWHVDGYHMNFDYPAVTADVTFTLTLNDDGKAAAIDCLLIDGKGAQAHGTITLDQPASVDTIKLVSEERGGSGNIALTNFKAEYIKGAQTIETAAKLPVKDESFTENNIPGYYSTNVGNEGKLAAYNGWLMVKKPKLNGEEYDWDDDEKVEPSEEAFIITMDKSIASGTRLELSLLYSNENAEETSGIQAFAEGQPLDVSDDVDGTKQIEYRTELTVPQHSDDWKIVLKTTKATLKPQIKNINIRGLRNPVSIDVDYSVDKGVSHRVASGALHGIDYKTPAEYLSDGIYIRALRGQAKHHEIDNNYEYLPGFLYEKTYNRVINRGDDTKLMIGLYYGYKPLANQVGGWQNKAVENGGEFWKNYIHDFMSEFYNEDGTKNRDVYSWIPWNEPDLQWGGLGNNFCQAYENAYDAVKEFDPTARVQGPECSWYEGGKMKSFLLYCKEHNCLPDVLSWHELTPHKMSIAAHCKELYDFMIANNIEPMEMAITEYQGLGYSETDEGRKKDGNYNTGLAISYISELENSEEYGMRYGLRSAWGYSGGDPRAKAYLGEMTDIATGTMPTGQWYVYNAYKQMTGRKIGVNISNPYNDDTIAALASVSSAVEDKSSTILIGNWNNGNNEYENAKDIKVTLKNIPEYLEADGEVNVRVEQIPETLAVPLYSPTIISDKTYKVTDGTVELDVTELYGRRAMAITVTTPEVDTNAVNMSELSPQATGDMVVSTSEGYVSVTGGEAPTYKDTSQVAPELDTTYKDNGDSVTFTVNVTEEGLYNLRINHKTGADKGFMQLYVDNKAVHYPTDLYSEYDGEKDTDYGNVYLKEGEHKLCFRIVGYGKNTDSTGYTLTFGDMTLAKLRDTTVKNVVTFNPAGGKVSQNSMLVKDKAERLPEITREGYKFLGWIDEDENPFTEETVVSKNMTVTAQWEQIFTVKLIANRDVCSLDYSEDTKKASITINTPKGSEISVVANKTDISDQVVYEDDKYILHDYDVTGDVVFIVNATAPESATTDPYVLNEAEKYSEQNNIQTEICDEGGMNVGYIQNGSWLKYRNVDFDNTGASKFEARVASAQNGGTIEIYIDSLDGTLIGTLAVTGTNGWQNWVTNSCNIVGDVKGVHDLYLKFTGDSGNLFNLNWWQFTRNSVFAAKIADVEVEGNEINVSVKVGNYTEADVSAQTAVALYNKDGVLQKIDLSDAVNYESGKSVSIDSKFAKPENIDGYYVKLFVWDSVDSMKPKVESCKYTFVNQ